MLRPIAFLGALAAAIAGSLLVYQRATQDAIPTLSVPDIDERTREFGKVQRTRGTVCARPATPGDELAGAAGPSFAGGAMPEGCQALASGQSLRLGTLIGAAAQSGLEFSAQGHWYMALDGEGGIILQDARRNPEGTERMAQVFVQKGMFRAKSGDGDAAKGHYLDVTTSAARVRVFAGEIGIEVGQGGRGRMWLVSGRAVATWKDGRRKELGLKGLEDL